MLLGNKTPCDRSAELQKQSICILFVPMCGQKFLVLGKTKTSYLFFFADKSLTDQQLETPKWELTKPLPLDDEGSSVESAIGKSPDVHYIYVCIKVCGLMLLCFQ